MLYSLFQFYEQASNLERWITDMTDRLNSEYNKSAVNLNDGERLIREIQVSERK